MLESLFSPNFVVRIVTTIAVFWLFKCLKITNLLVLVSSLFALDCTDCGLYNLFSKVFAYTPIDPNSVPGYQIPDKIWDFVTYTAFLFFFGDIFDAYTRWLLYAFMALRFVGVVAFTKTGNAKYLVVFPDFVNSTMVAYLIKEWMNPGATVSSYSELVAMSMMAKVCIEYGMHYGG